ncbi:hypothetical protein [Streptomyces sp. NPDC046261]|uniref:hypothetical protein n=1 Tax=Streptomyces sp. NPDC046261 TaxID=3157200 RepID=UPI0033F6AE60
MNGFVTTSGKALLALSAAAVLGLTGTATAQAQTTSQQPTRAAAGTAADAVRARLAQPGAAAAGRIVCYRVHVAEQGWLPAECDGGVAGTTGQSRRIEAIEVAVGNVGWVCLNAHLADTAWQGTRCGNDFENVVAGTTGQSRRLEALNIRVSSGSVWARAHVQDIGWQNAVRGKAVTVGTTGQSRRMEAVQIDV